MDLSVDAQAAVPQEDLPESLAPAAASSAVVPAHDLPSAPEEDKSEKYGGGIQQAIAGVEGIAKGIAGPLATGAERLLGVPKEDIIGREEANPWTHGIGEATGLVGGLFTGTGEAALLGKAAEAVSAGAKLGKVGSTAIKAGIEAGLFQGGDEISKAILGQSDPEAPVSSALAHMGAASLLGGTGGVLLGKVGSKLAQLAEGRTASKASQFLSDLGNRFEFLTKNKDIHGAATEEAHNLWQAVDSAYSETWGNGGLKEQAIKKLVPEMNEKISGQTQNIATKLQEQISGMMKDPDTYPARLTKMLEKESNQWMETATNPNASSFDVFNATQKLKQNLQLYSKFDKSISAIAPERGFIDAAKSIGFDLRNALEDKNVWGGAGELQQGINKAFSELQPFQKDFLKSFSTKKLGESEIDPDKIGSMLRQIGKGKGALRGSKLADFLEPAQKFLSKVDNLHSELGVENAYPRVSTNILDEMLSGKSSPGAKAADWLFGGGPKSIGMMGAHAAGAVTGGVIGGPMGGYLGYRAGEHLAPILEEGLGRKLTRSAVSGVLRAMSAGSHEGVPQAINYAESISKGAQKINSAVDNIFTIGGQKYLNHDVSEMTNEAIKKYIAEGNLNQEIENQKNQQSGSAQMPIQGFAHGGEVLAPEPTQPVSKPVAPVLEGTDKISQVFPEQSMLLGAAKGRINNYLNSIRPQSVQSKLPFDEEMPDKAKNRSYESAVKIAAKPLRVLDKIKNGTLDIEHMQHMSQLYPELTNHLQKKLTERIVKAQMSNEKPPYKVQQAMSLFLGAPLDSTMTPSSIQAAQAVFQMKKPMPAQSGSKGSASKLKDVPNQYRTADQSRQLRQTRSK